MRAPTRSRRRSRAQTDGRPRARPRETPPAESANENVDGSPSLPSVTIIRPCRGPCPGYQPGREPEDGADVNTLRRAGHSPRPLVAPASKLAEDRHELLGSFGELVIHARRNLAVALAGRACRRRPCGSGANAIARSKSQEGCAAARRSGGARRKVADDEQGPLVTDQIEGPGIRRPLIVGVAFGRGYVRNGSSRRTENLPTNFESNVAHRGATENRRPIGQMFAPVFAGAVVTGH